MNIPRIANLSNYPIKAIAQQEEKKCSPRSLYNLPEGMTITPQKGCYQQAVKLTPDELFDIQFNSGTRLSNDAILIRPVILSLGDVDIKPLQDQYKVSIKSNSGNGRVETKTFTEDELLKNRTLSRGLIKEVEPGLYNMVLNKKNGEFQDYYGTKEKCLQLLKDNFLYM